MVDEIRLGFLVAISIVISVVIIVLSSSGPFFAAQASTSEIKDSHIISESPAPYLSSSFSSDPERNLRDAYNSKALEEIDRCLGNEYSHGGNGIDKPFCADNMALLKKSCENPQTYIQACENDIFKNYLQQNAI
jgi:hypothetical protein